MFADGPFGSLTFSTESNYVIFIDIRNVKLRTNVENSNDGKTIAIEIRKNQVTLRTKVEKARKFVTGVNYISESDKPVIMENQNEL